MDIRIRIMIRMNIGIGMRIRIRIKNDIWFRSMFKVDKCLFVKFISSPPLSNHPLPLSHPSGLGRILEGEGDGSLSGKCQ